MAKNSVKQIEQDEKRILDELSKNANKTINDIAETCGFSRQKVWRAIRNLEKNHTIWGYPVSVDEEKLNKKEYILLIKRTNKPISKEMAKKIIENDLGILGKDIGIKVKNSYFTHGIYDWVICFSAPSIQEAKTIIEILNRLYEGIISEMHLLETLYPVISYGVKNPEIEKISDFFKI